MNKGRLVKATPHICRMCKYRSGDQTEVCAYMAITGHSRIYVDGKAAYDVRYCDKFERGKRIVPDNSLKMRRRDEFPENGWQE